MSGTTAESEERVQLLNVGALNLHSNAYKLAFIHHQVLFFVGRAFPHVQVMPAGGKTTLGEAWEEWGLRGDPLLGPQWRS